MHRPDYFIDHPLKLMKIHDNADHIQLIGRHSNTYAPVVPMHRLDGAVIKPDRMGGGEFAKLYREQAGPHAPIVVITAAQGAEERAREVGADGYLGKPFPLATLLEVVARHAG